MKFSLELAHIEQLYRQHHQGNHFHVRIQLNVPGHELVSGSEPDENRAYSDLYIAM